MWLQLIGFLANLRCIRELANSVRIFGKMVFWDRVRTTDAAVLIKVYVDVLKHIPASIIISADKNKGESWTCLVVIIHENLRGEGPPDEDPVPVDGNPHPRPDEEHHHPNQNHIIGPFLDVHNPNQDGGNMQDDDGNNAANDDIEVEEPGWGHWAMPPQLEAIDQELFNGEFLEMQDLLGPMPVVEQAPPNLPDMDNDSDITLSLALIASSASTA